MADDQGLRGVSAIKRACLASIHRSDPGGAGLSGAGWARRSRACRSVCSGVVKQSLCAFELVALADVMRHA